MTKRAALPDGTILEFPDETPDEVMDRAVKQHLTEAPDYAAAAAQDAASGAQGDPEGLTGAVTDEGPPRNTLADLAASFANAGAGVAQGIAAVPDALFQAGNAVQRGANAAVDTIGTGALRGLGMDSAADWFHKGAQGVEQDIARRPTLSDLIEKGVPTPEWGGTERFMGQMVGGAMIPMGPKTVKPAAIPVAAPANAAREVIDAGEQAGVRVMTSDVKPPRTFMGKAAQTIGERIPLAGTGGNRAAQQTERVEAVKSVLSDYGADDTAAAMGDVIADLTKTRGAELTRLKVAKDSVINGLEGNVPVDRTLTVIDREVARLKGINETAFSPFITKLEQFKAELANGKTLEQIEGNRKLLGDLFKDPSLAAIAGDGQKALNAIYAPLRVEMGTFIRHYGGEGGFNKWKAANDRLSAMAGELNSRALKSVLNDAETTPENVSKLLFSTKPSDVQRLYGGLSAEGRTRAQSAILAKAMENAGGLENVSPDRFLGQLVKLGKQTGVFFQGGDLARVNGLTRVLAATKRAGEAAVAPPTGVQAMPYAMTAGLTAAFGLVKGALAAAGIGGLARAYESAAVRNALMRVSKAPKGSWQEGHALENASKALYGALSEHAPALNDNIPASAAAGENPEDSQQQQAVPQP